MQLYRCTPIFLSMHTHIQRKLAGLLKAQQPYPIYFASIWSDGSWPSLFIKNLDLPNMTVQGQLFVFHEWFELPATEVVREYLTNS